jgi:arginyl-tRNA synthetase
LGKLYAFFKDIPDEDKDEKARYYFKLLSDGEKEYVDLWQQFRQISIKEFEKVYEILGVQFDLYEGESFAEKYVPQIIEDLEKS